MKERIVKDTFFYSISTFLAKCISVVRSIIVARFLGPSLYGLWNALSIVLEYSRYSSLGISNAMNREVPFYRGKGDNKKATDIRRIGFSMAVLPSAVVGFVIILVSLFMYNRVSIEWIAALRAIAALVLMRQLYDFFQLLLRSDNRFKFLSTLQLSFAVLDFLLVVGLVIKFHFFGFLWGIVLNYVIIIGVICYKSFYRYSLRFYFNKDIFISLVKIGIFITLIVVVENLRMTIDRVMIIKFLGIKELGYFGISYLLIQFIFLIPSSISNIIYPRLVERYGSSNKEEGSLKNYIEVTTQILSYSMPILIGMIYILLPTLVNLFLPQYVLGIRAAQI
ncbi:oligosaccharide flippase family protein, partial [Candidatus Omnitrophota bacterium]